MNNEVKCQLAVCHCRAQVGRSYCSDDCEQAASQGVEREFCQCSHGDCKTSSFSNLLQVDLAGLREPLHFFTSGQITIHYDSMDDLTQQVQALAAALTANESAERSINIAGGFERRPAGSESGATFAKSRSA